VIKLSHNYHLNIEFLKDNLAFDNLSPIIDILYPYLIKTKTEGYISNNYENLRYIFPLHNSKNLRKRLSLTSAVKFEERIRFYSYTKVKYPVNLLCNLLFEFIIENKRSEFIFDIKYVSNISKVEEMFLNLLITKYFTSNVSNLKILIDDKEPIKMGNYLSQLNDVFVTNSYENYTAVEIKLKFEKSISLGLHEDAIRLGNLLVDKYYTEDLDLRINVGLAYVLFGYPEIGEEHYLYVLDNAIHPKTKADVLYCLAMLNMRHNVKEKLNPEKAEYYLNLGKDVIENNKNQLKEDYPYLKIFNRNGRALAEFRKGNVELAHEYCDNGQRELFKIYGDDKHLLHRSVLVYNCTMTSGALNKTSLTKTYFDLLLSLDPYYSDYWYHKAKFHVKQEELDDAVHALNQAIKLNSHNEEYYIERAEINIYIENLDLAEKDFQSALKINPLNETAILNYSALLINIGEPEKALKFLRDISYMSYGSDIANNLGLAYLDCKMIAESIEEFEKAIKLDPSSIGALANLANALYQNGDINKSMMYLDKGLDKEPNNETFLYNKLMLLEELGDEKEVELFKNRIYSVGQTYPEVLDLLMEPTEQGEVHEENNQPVQN
jgi:Tfp pilus assembly protein PilF